MSTVNLKFLPHCAVLGFLGLVSFFYFWPTFDSKNYSLHNNLKFCLKTTKQISYRKNKIIGSCGVEISNALY